MRGKSIHDDGILPLQRSGGQTLAQKRRRLRNTKEARAAFDVVSARLLDVNSWKAYGAAGEFRLVDDDGTLLDGEAKKGRMIRIDLPGPGGASGDGYDWVRIEAIEQENKNDKARLGLRVRPIAAPNSNDTSHFYTTDTTNTFLLQRDRNLIVASIIGRNERTNTSPESKLEAARNVVMANLAWLIGSEKQWEAFLDGILEVDL